MKKVLILGVAAVQMDAITVLKELGYEVFACAMAKDGPGADIADHFDIINFLDIPKVTEHIIANKINAIYSVGSDIAMPVANKISEDLSLPHFVSSSAARKCNDKSLMRETLGQNFFGNIPFQIIDSKTDVPKIPLPFIMKPTDSQGQRGIVLVDTINKYHDHFKLVKSFSRSGKVIIEKFVDGPEISVNAYIVDGRLRFMATSLRETWPQFLGLIYKHKLPVKSLNQKQIKLLEEIVEKSCNKMGIHNGPAYLQIKMENDNPYIIEMTPRLDGCHMWKLINYGLGINILKLTFEHLLNENLSELEKMSSELSECELEFFCQAPNSIFEPDKFIIPKDSIEHFFYYQTGDTIRPINGKFEKVGYSIQFK